MSDEEKWAANVAFVGNKEAVREILKLVNSLEENGKINEVTSIDGPYESLQLMLKRRVENLSLEVSQNNTDGKNLLNSPPDSDSSI